MSPDEFRRRGHEVIEWIASYMERVADFPVQSRSQPGALRNALPEQPPMYGEPFDAVMNDLDSLIVPGLTHWQSPNFFGYFPANSSGPAILGELLSAGLGVQGMLWSTSPACTELETHMMDWVARMLELPQKFHPNNGGGGVIQDTASSATLCALLAARERVTAKHESGDDPASNLVAYCSNQAHSSIEKAVRIAGIGENNLRMIDVDDTYAMRPDLLEQAIARDRHAGNVPFFVCATIGTTSSNAFDPLPAIGQVAASDEHIWLHVDAAMSGTAAVCPEFRHIHNGLALADSYCFNPHKWMLTNFDCDCFFVADTLNLTKSLSILPEYLRNKATESGAVIDYRDWQIPLGRRFRALKLWMVIRHYGVHGIQQHVRHSVSLAKEFAEWVKADPRFELVIQPELNLVCFCLRIGDDATRQLLNAANASGKVFLTHTVLRDRFVLRMAIGATMTEHHHVKRCWSLLQELA